VQSSFVAPFIIGAPSFVLSLIHSRTDIREHFDLLSPLLLLLRDCLWFIGFGDLFYIFSAVNYFISLSFLEPTVRVDLTEDYAYPVLIVPTLIVNTITLTSIFTITQYIMLPSATYLIRKTMCRIRSCCLSTKY